MKGVKAFLRNIGLAFPEQTKFKWFSCITCYIIKSVIMLKCYVLSFFSGQSPSCRPSCKNRSHHKPLFCIWKNLSSSDSDFQVHPKFSYSFPACWILEIVEVCWKFCLMHFYYGNGNTHRSNGFLCMDMV